MSKNAKMSRDLLIDLGDFVNKIEDQIFNLLFEHDKNLYDKLREDISISIQNDEKMVSLEYFKDTWKIVRELIGEHDKTLCMNYLTACNLWSCQKSVYDFYCISSNLLNDTETDEPKETKEPVVNNFTKKNKGFIN